MRMGYTPTGYKEMFVTAVDKESGKEEVKMVYEYPDNGEGLPRTVDLGVVAVVSEPSEMVVKRQGLF